MNMFYIKKIFDLYLQKRYTSLQEKIDLATNYPHTKIHR